MNRVILITIAVALLAGCRSPVVIGGSVGEGVISDQQLIEASEVRNVAYTMEFTEIYRGEYELKKAAILVCEGTVGKKGPNMAGQALAEGICIGLTKHLALSNMTVSIPAPAYAGLGFEKLAAGAEKEDKSMGSLTKSLRVKSATKTGTWIGNVKPYGKVAAMSEFGRGGAGRVSGCFELTGGLVVGFGSTVYTADDLMSATARELEVDVLFFITAKPDKTELSVVVPFANLKVAGGDRPYPVEFNHCRAITIFTAGMQGSLSDGERVGQLLARRFRLWYPGSGS